MQFQISQSKAHTPTRICLVVTTSIPSSHVPNNVLMEFGGVILNAMWTDLHKIFAKGQSRKRCLIDSSLSQKLHHLDPVQLRIIIRERLATTFRVTHNLICDFLCNPQMKVSIFVGSVYPHKELAMI